MSSQIGGVTPLNQIRLTNVAYVRLKKGGNIFEVAAYRNKVVNWRNKIETDLDEVLQVQDVFTNVARGLVASKNDLLRGFDTTDKRKICEEILEKGEFQISELERKSLLDGMFRDVASIVVEKSINTDTGRPYSISMIQNAMKDIHYSVNLSKNAKQQALDVIRRLRKVMPIARSKLQLRITVPAASENEVKQMLVANSGEVSNNDKDRKSTLLPPKEKSQDSGVVVIEANISPELFRTVEEQVTAATGGKGILEIIHSQQQPASSQLKEEEGSGVGNDPNLDDHSHNSQSNQNSNSNKNDASSKSSRGKNKNKNKLSLAQDDTSDSIGSGDRDNEVVFFMSKGSGQRQSKKEKKKQMKKKQRQRSEEESDEELEGSGGGSGEEEEDEKMEQLRRLEEKMSLAEQKQARAESAVTEPKEHKKSKKNRRLEKQQQKEMEAKEKERREVLASIQTEDSTMSSMAGGDKSTKSTDPNLPSDGAFKCNTCGVSFTSRVDHRTHFKSDWHRINLKRKLRKLPLVTSEEEFYSKLMEHWDCDIEE